MNKKVLFSTSLVLAFTVSQAQKNDAPANSELWFEGSKIEVKKNVVTLHSKKNKNTVVISSSRPQNVQLYIFDLEGTILYQGILKNKEKTKIDTLGKGIYTYTVFAKDESVEEGQLVIK